MTLRSAAVIAVATLGLAGCGDSPAAKPPAPLSVADWKAMPTDQKYTPEALERLKEGDPKLQTPEGWEAFQKTVVQPARKKDFPAGKPK
jgi:hypothetical protein